MLSKSRLQIFLLCSLALVSWVGLSTNLPVCMPFLPASNYNIKSLTLGWGSEGVGVGVKWLPIEVEYSSVLVKKTQQTTKAQLKQPTSVWDFLLSSANIFYSKDIMMSDIINDGLDFEDDERRWRWQLLSFLGKKSGFPSEFESDFNWVLRILFEFLRRGWRWRLLSFLGRKSGFPSEDIRRENRPVSFSTSRVPSPTSQPNKDRDKNEDNYRGKEKYKDKYRDKYLKNIEYTLHIFLSI